jgi:hypothetical protein
MIVDHPAFFNQAKARINFLLVTRVLLHSFFTPCYYMHNRMGLQKNFWLC